MTSLKSFIISLYQLKSQLFVSVVAFLVFSSAGQILDVIQIEIENFDNSPLLTLIRFLPLVFLSACLWFAATSSQASYLNEDAQTEHNKKALLGAVAIVTALPLIGVFVGLMQLVQPIEVLAFGVLERPILTLSHLGSVGIMVLVFYLLKVVERRISFSDFQEIIQRRAIMFAVPLALLIIIVTATLNYERPWFIEAGVIFLICLFLIQLSLFFNLLTHWSLKTRLPLLGLIVIYLFVNSFLESNLNHDIRLTKRTSEPSDVKSSFQSWFSSRADRDYYSSRGLPYPVYFVTAEGGGIYAAEHAAKTLSRIQDMCPSFAQHVFAMSGVSGGSLGIALFSSLMKQKSSESGPNRCRETTREVGPTENQTRKYFENDFFTPLLSATLFPEVYQLFLFWPVNEWDRTIVMERSFEKSWSTLNVASNNPFSMDVLGIWSADKTSPALILNTTEVESGESRPISPFSYSTHSFLSDGLLTHDDVHRYSLRLSTAVGISARFPWMSSPGRLNPELPDNVIFRPTHFVDGGYFENSGTHEIGKLIDDLKPIIEKENLELRVIVIQSIPVSGNYSKGLAELLTPIRGLLNTRYSRGQASVHEMLDRFCQNGLLCDDAPSFRELPVRWFHLHDEWPATLPLGWVLSNKSKATIDRSIGYLEECTAGNELATAFESNGCTIRFLEQDLMGDLE
ncbi:MAG: SoxR reducing system RseC family protein [Pseudomonadota bacterium]